MVTTNPKPLIYDLDLIALDQMLQSWGEPEYRAKQVWHGLYHQLWNRPHQFTNLPESLRQRLDQVYSFEYMHVDHALESRDKDTIKVLFHIPDGQSVETVLMKYNRRRTLCISSQAGCAMGCVFCATGQMGFRRNLSSGEIVEQVLYFARFLSADEERVTHVVIMGMGEPFHNYDATMTAIDRLNNKDGFNLGARRITISTVGLVPGIRRFTKENRQVNLAVSLHAADDELRSSLLPVNHRYPLQELISSCLDYVERSNRRITFEWALIQGVNDTPEQAKKLAARLQAFRRSGSALCHVNIIPLNPTFRYAGVATTHQRALAFQSILEKDGIPCTIRLRRGIDIQAGCGQLAIDSSNR